MADKESKTPAPQEAPSRLSEPPRLRAKDQPTVIPTHWGPDLMLYTDLSRMMFRMHRNLEAHMDAHKRLAERLQAVFAHEQEMVLELARLIDQSMSSAARGSNAEKQPLGAQALDRIFDHASNAMKETGKMLTDIQLESLDLLKRYIAEAAETNSGKGAVKGKGKE